jgi:BirA family biotin operon repressor/biotin-[acetyl-CoA-carboxylase] ligase
MNNFGQPLRHVQITGSTNDEAQRWALEDAPHGAVVRADEQTHGRGRQGRDWCSPAGLGLYLSLILRPDIALSQVPQLTMLAALGAARAIESETNLPANVKWPNDIVLRGRKIGGVLSEARPREENPQRADYVIVGIGLNVNFAREDLPRDVKIPATSLYMETGHVRPLANVMNTLLREIETLYDEYSSGAWHELRAEFARRDILQGQAVRVEASGETYRGEAAGIDEDGTLLVRTPASVRRVVAGDVLLHLD